MHVFVPDGRDMHELHELFFASLLNCQRTTHREHTVAALLLRDATLSHLHALYMKSFKRLYEERFGVRLTVGYGLTEAPTARVPRSHSIAVTVFVHVPAEVLTLRTVRPAGRDTLPAFRSHWRI